MKKSNLHIYLFLLIIVTFINSPLAYAQISQDELAKKVDAICLVSENTATPGSAVLVVKDGKIILNKGYGLANLEHKIPNTPHTVFDLASLSKQFTGYAIALLIEQGKISADDNIRTYIPELPDFGHTIKIRHLIHHTSGLRDWTSTLPLSGRSFEDVISFDQILRMAFAQKTLNFVPGSEYSYSNTGYNLLAELVQRVTGSTFRDWVEENIFGPLDMSHTFFLDDHTEIIANRAYGYYKGEQNQFHHSPNNLTALGSSSMYSTTTDLAKWVMHLHNPGKEHESVVHRMYTQGILNNGEKISYAYGLSIEPFRDTKWIAHSGSWASFSTYLILLPDYGLSVVVLNNTNHRNASRIVRQIASLYVPELTGDEDHEGKTTTKKEMISAELSEDYTGVYKIGPARYFNITLEDNQLWVRATDEDKYPMTAVSEGVFSVEDYGGRTITFHRDHTGQVAQLEYNGMSGQKMKGRSTFSPENVKEYLGEYGSDELHTTYTVISEEGQLMLRHFRHGDIQLEPVWNDDFLGERWFARAVEFHRDKDGIVSALSITTTRARKQRFIKLNDD